MRFSEAIIKTPTGRDTLFPYLNEDEKTLEAMALVEMLVKRMLMVGSRVGTFTLKASGSSCRSATDVSVTF
jgi:hypothetical protein